MMAEDEIQSLLLVYLLLLDGLEKRLLLFYLSGIHC